MRIATERLELVPATEALVRAEIDSAEDFARRLGARVPTGWPPETVADALPYFLERLRARPEEAGWWNWYAVVRGERDGDRELVGSGGFQGPPADGTVEIGYSVLPEFRGKGYATEIVGGLVTWARSQPGVRDITARTEGENPASARVLLKAGFAPQGEGRFTLEPLREGAMRVSYAIVFVRDMQRSTAFYRDVVGLPLRFESPQWTEFETGDATLALHHSDAPAGPDDDPDHLPAGRCRPGLGVPDLDAFHRRMVEHGVRCLREPKTEFGARLAQYVDPDGLVLSVGEDRRRS